MTSKREPILIAAIIAIIIAWVVLETCRKNNKSIPEKPTITQPKEVKVQRANIEAAGRSKDDSLKSVADKWKKEALTNKAKLAAAQNQVNGLLVDLGWYEDQTSDSATIRNDYEIETEVIIAHLVVANKYKDSVANATIRNQDSTIQATEHRLAQKDSLYAQSRLLFDKSLADQEKLIDYSKKLKKQVRKKNFGNIVWKVVAGGAILLLANEKLK